MPTRPTMAARRNIIRGLRITTVPAAEGPYRAIPPPTARTLTLKPPVPTTMG